MIRADAIQLVSENPEAHGIFDEIEETARTVPAEIRSVSMSETYRALSNQLNPQYVFILQDYAEYQDEKVILWNSKRWRVVRTYVNAEKIELTVEEATIDAQ